MPQTGWAQDAVHEGAQPSFAEPWAAFFATLSASGSLRLDYFSSSKTLDNETNFYGATAQLKFLPLFSDVFDAKLEARFTNPDITHGDRTPSTATLLEGYVSAHIKNVDLRIGKQNVAWGRADAINPTDNLSPKNYTVLLPFQEDRRFGTTSIKLDAQVTPEHTITLFMTPLFEPSIIPLPLPPGAVVLNNNIPPHTLSNSEVGLKLNKTSGETDWSVSYYHGFNLFPEIRLKGFVPPSSPLLELRYPEIDVAGADVAKNYGRYGFRAEAAYIAPKDYNSEEPTAIQPYLYYVLGVDRTFLENLNINLQLVGSWVPSFKDPRRIPNPIQRAVITENAILFYQQHRANYGLTSRISDRWFHDTLEAELLLVIYFNPTNMYLRPVVTYAFTDRVKGSVGGDIYSGPHDSFFGLLEQNQTFFAEVRYTF